MSDEIEVVPINPLGSINEVEFVKFLGDTSFVDKLLKQKCHDDIIYEHAEFAICCTLRNPTVCLYRWLFEQTYLRNEKVSRYIAHSGVFIIRASLSEILGYIQKVTPPYLAHTIESLNSIEDIIGALNMFLIESKGDQFHQYYLNTFENCLRICEFDTAWTYNDKRLREKWAKVTVNKSFVRVVDAYDESTRNGRMTFAIIPNPENIDRVQKALSVYKISNIHVNDDGSIYIAIVKI